MRSRHEPRVRAFPCVLLDINTQRDFLEDGGNRPVFNRRDLWPALRRVIAWAKWNQVPVVSAVACHRPSEVMPEGIPRHCVDGTPGQQKLGFTVFGSFVKVESDCTLAVPTDLFSEHQQVIFRKRTMDFFMNPKADRFLTHLQAAEYVVTGVALEESVRAVALGLLARGKKVTVVIDAVGYWDFSSAELAARILRAKGVETITVNELATRRVPRLMRYPRVCLAQVSLRNGLYGSLNPPNGETTVRVAYHASRNGTSTNGRNGHNGRNGNGGNGQAAHKGNGNGVKH